MMHLEVWHLVVIVIVVVIATLMLRNKAEKKVAEVKAKARKAEKSIKMCLFTMAIFIVLLLWFLTKVGMINWTF